MVSLLTPVYNALPWLRTYLECVRTQTYRPLLFIAVDDGSSDGSYEYLLQYRTKLEQAGVETLILRQEHGGQAAAMDRGLQYVKGEFLTWCDADDRLTPDATEKKVAWLTAHPELGMVRSDGILTAWDKGGASRRMASPQDRHTQDIFDALFHETTYCCSGCYLVRTSLMFACYPDRHIPLSKEGQNLQLLLPPASRTECGFIPETLFYYDVRNTGHASLKRSFTQQMERAAGFYRLRSEILAYCDCDRAQYEIKNKEIYEQTRRQLLHSAAVSARESLKR